MPRGMALSATPFRRARLAWAALALLAGCQHTGKDGYPSLATRPAERHYAPPAAASQAAAADADPALLATLARHEADAQHAAAEFDRAADAARRAVDDSRQSAVGSEAWATATVALAALDSARSATALPLADLDALMAQQALGAAGSNAPRDQAGYAAAARSDHAVAELVAREDATIAALHAGRE